MFKKRAKLYQLEGSDGTWIHADREESKKLPPSFIEKKRKDKL